MPLNNTAKNIGVDAVTAVIGFLSLHTADPGGTGANEATGGSPAYARKAITWGASSSGVAAASGSPVVTFDAPAGTYTHVGFWSALSGGTNYGDDDLPASVVLGAQGTVDIDTGSITWG